MSDNPTEKDASTVPTGRSAIVEHLSKYWFTAPLIGYTLTTSRALALSRGNHTTFEYLASLSQSIASLISMLAIFLQYSTIFGFAVIWSWSSRHPERIRQFARASITILALVSISLNSFAILAIGTVSNILAVMGMKYAREALTHWGPRILFATTATFLLLGGTRMWIPAERIELTSKDPIVGYVLERDSEYFHILQLGNHLLAIVDTKEIKSRTICDDAALPDHFLIAQSVWQIVTGNSSIYKKCKA